MNIFINTDNQKVIQNVKNVVDEGSISLTEDPYETIAQAKVLIGEVEEEINDFYLTQLKLYASTLLMSFHSNLTKISDEIEVGFINGFEREFWFQNNTGDFFIDSFHTVYMLTEGRYNQYDVQDSNLFSGTYFSEKKVIKLF